MAWWFFGPNPTTERPWLVHRPVWSGALLDEEMRFTLSADWEPTNETMRHAQKRIAAAFERERDEFFARACAKAEERHFEHPPHLPRELVRNLRWLIRYQVLGENFTEIAKRKPMADPENSGRKTISCAVSGVAKLIGIRLRKPDTGAVLRR